MIDLYGTIFQIGDNIWCYSYSYTQKNLGKSVFFLLKYYTSVTFIPRVSFGANQPLNNLN
jgi:hypothetical protein